jgi:hypothetical protein
MTSMGITIILDISTLYIRRHCIKSEKRMKHFTALNLKKKEQKHYGQNKMAEM